MAGWGLRRILYWQVPKGESHPGNDFRPAGFEIVDVGPALDLLLERFQRLLVQYIQFQIGSLEVAGNRQDSVTFLDGP